MSRNFEIPNPLNFEISYPFYYEIPKPIVTNFHISTKNFGICEEFWMDSVHKPKPSKFTLNQISFFVKISILSKNSKNFRKFLNANQPKNFVGG